MKNSKGFIHSFYNGSCLDGPGLRSVVFLAGCNLTCPYCHNIDVCIEQGSQMTAGEVYKKISRYLPYIDGVTISGGEPLTQPAFLYELLKLLKVKKINTAVETNGTIINHKIFKMTDLLIVDIKNQLLPLCTYAPIFSKYKNVTATNVLIKGVNDSQNKLREINEFVAKYNINLKFLPFRKTEAQVKYEKLGLAFKYQDA